MAEVMDLIKIGIAAAAFVFFALMIAGFYFTATNASGQGIIIGQFEILTEAIFSAVSAPFKAIASIIGNLPKLIGLWIVSKGSTIMMMVMVVF